MFSLAIKLINSLFVQRAAARYIINELEPAKKTSGALMKGKPSERASWLIAENRRICHRRRKKPVLLDLLLKYANVAQLSLIRVSHYLPVA